MTKIIFYTHPASPFAHRVNIALRELGLEFEEVILDLGEPREPWFLELNPVCPCCFYQLDSWEQLS